MCQVVCLFSHLCREYSTTYHIYTLSLHDALPISCVWNDSRMRHLAKSRWWQISCNSVRRKVLNATTRPSRAVRKIGKHTSELQSPVHLVCRLLLEKKKLCGSGKFKHSKT